MYTKTLLPFMSLLISIFVGILIFGIIYQIWTAVKRPEKQLPSKANLIQFFHLIALYLG